jgi:hypothetical protein
MKKPSPKSPRTDRALPLPQLAAVAGGGFFDDRVPRTGGIPGPGEGHRQ